MLLPVPKMFTVTRGVSFDYPFQWLLGTPESSTPQDLSTSTGSMAITSWDGLTTYMTLSTGGTLAQTGLYFGGNPATPSNGIIDIVIAAADTAAITWPTARYNLVITNTAVTPHKVARLLYGSIGVFGFLP